VFKNCHGHADTFSQNENNIYGYTDSKGLKKEFSFYMATCFSDGGSRSTRREPPTMGKQLVNFITCGCESSAPFL
jgi:hypothetical protein